MNIVKMSVEWMSKRKERLLTKTRAVASCDLRHVSHVTTLLTLLPSLMEKRFLRILYTINAGQYILARSLTAVETTTIPSSTEGAAPSYGYVSLRRCLNIVCQSSPEVFQDLSNGGSDFSVYHLDPLEAETAPEQLSITDNGESRSTGPQTRGVAVGMGLMSWGLHSEEGEEATLNGTLTRLANGSAGLEVILALREVSCLFTIENAH